MLVKLLKRTISGNCNLFSPRMLSVIFTFLPSTFSPSEAVGLALYLHTLNSFFLPRLKCASMKLFAAHGFSIFKHISRVLCLQIDASHVKCLREIHTKHNDAPSSPHPRIKAALSSSTPRALCSNCYTDDTSHNNVHKSRKLLSRTRGSFHDERRRVLSGYPVGLKLITTLDVLR